MPIVRVTPEGLTYRGRPMLLQAGTFQYFRLPDPGLWRSVLTRIRLAGLNAVVVPFPWAYHSPAEGFYDFTGPRDVDRLLEAIEDAGLWLIPHVGPWVGQGLDAGGVPAWLFRSPGLAPDCSASPAGGPSRGFLRHVSTWWSHLFGLLEGQPHLAFMMADAGRCADERALRGYGAPLLADLERLWSEIPRAFPRAQAVTSGDPSSLSFFPIDSDRPEAMGSFSPHDVVWLDVEPPEPRSRSSRGRRAPDGEALHIRVAELLGAGCRTYVLNPVHGGVTWGWWSAESRCERYGRGAPIPEDWSATVGTLSMRRTALSAEIFAESLTEGQPEPNAHASPPGTLRAARRGDAGAVAFVRSVDRGAGSARISLGTPDGTLMTPEVHLSEGRARILPLDWAIAGGKVLTTTMEPVLHAFVAGRHLLVLCNEEGGRIELSGFRARHRRGPVTLDPQGDRLRARFDAARLTSLLLSGPEEPLQILALDGPFAHRVWPLDDRWRSTPFVRTSWDPEPEEPARGVVIGPEWVLPEPDGGYRFLAGERGLGYRWGPWRGSDPRTWLAPVAWRSSRPVDLPTLVWERQEGAPEILVDYPDESWRSLATGTSLSAGALDLGYGFMWYRAHFRGRATSVILRTPDACDLFLNGAHVAALSPPPEGEAIRTLRIPLPSRHLRGESLGDDNLLAVLVEHGGRPPRWDQAARPHGLLACELEGAQIAAWRVRPGLNGEVQRQGFAGFCEWERVGERGLSESGALEAELSAITWHRATFTLSLPDDLEVPITLRLEGAPRSAYLYLNGRMIGHACYPQRGQRRFWLPEGVLRRQGQNEIVIAQWTRGGRPGLGRVGLEAGTPLQWHAQPRVH